MSFSCPLCSASLQEADLEAHLRVELLLPAFRCLLCPVSFPGWADVDEHFRGPLAKHPGQQPQAMSLPAGAGKKARLLELLRLARGGPGAVEQRLCVCGQCQLLCRKNDDMSVDHVYTGFLPKRPEGEEETENVPEDHFATDNGQYELSAQPTPGNPWSMNFDSEMDGQPDEELSDQLYRQQGVEEKSPLNYPQANISKAIIESPIAPASKVYMKKALPPVDHSVLLPEFFRPMEGCSDVRCVQCGSRIRRTKNSSARAVCNANLLSHLGRRDHRESLEEYRRRMEAKLARAKEEKERITIRHD